MRSLLNLTGLVSGDTLPAQAQKPSFARRIKGQIRQALRRRVRNKVVITGCGVVSPIGNGLDSFWDGLLEGQTGMNQITRFDASTFPCQKLKFPTTIRGEHAHYIFFTWSR